MQEIYYIPSISVALYDRAEAAASKGQSCVVIMLCSASIEAFINEYYEFCRLCSTKKNGGNERLGNKLNKIISIGGCLRREIDLCDELEKLEDARKNIYEKIDAIKNYLDNGESWSKDSVFYRDFCTLINIRNEIVHPRSRTVKFGDNFFPKSLSNLRQQKKIIYFTEVNDKMSWVESIDTVNFSNWCIKSFQGMLKSLLEIMKNAKFESQIGSPLIPTITNQYGALYESYFNFKDVIIE